MHTFKQIPDKTAELSASASPLYPPITKSVHTTRSMLNSTSIESPDPIAEGMNSEAMAIETLLDAIETTPEEEESEEEGEYEAHDLKTAPTPSPTPMVAQSMISRYQTLSSSTRLESPPLPRKSFPSTHSRFDDFREHYYVPAIYSYCGAHASSPTSPPCPGSPIEDLIQRSSSSFLTPPPPFPVPRFPPAPYKAEIVSDGQFTTPLSQTVPYQGVISVATHSRKQLIESTGRERIFFRYTPEALEGTVEGTARMYPPKDTPLHEYSE